MSARNRFRVVLVLSALMLPACSDEMETPTAPVPSDEGSVASLDARRSPVLEFLPDARTGTADVVNTTVYDPARAGSLLSVRQKSRRSETTSEMRVVRAPGAGQLTWLINGRPLATLDYGPLPRNGTSIEAATAGGRLSFYNASGDLTAVYDPATRKLSRVRAISDRNVDINPFGDGSECEAAIFGFYGSVVALALAMDSGSPGATWGGMVGLYYTWRKVETDCYWVYRVTMWEFANSALGAWWYR